MKTFLYCFVFFYRRLHSRAGKIKKAIKFLKNEEKCFRCGTFASVYFVASEGDIVSCSNDLPKENVIGNVLENTFRCFFYSCERIFGASDFLVLIQSNKRINNLSFF